MSRDDFATTVEGWQKELVQTGRLTKLEAIRAANQLRTRNKKAWDKGVAQAFGRLLQQINKLNALHGKRGEMLSPRGGVLCVAGEMQLPGGTNLFEETTPVVVQPRIHVSKISCGGSHVVAYSPHKNRVYSWGDNSFGQLGQGGGTIFSPHPVDDTAAWSLEEDIEISCGYAFSIVVSHNNMWSAGASENGRLGIGVVTGDQKRFGRANIPAVRSVTSGSVACAAVTREGGQILTWGKGEINGQEQDLLTPTPLDNFGGKHFFSDSSGNAGYHFLAVTQAGELYSWGHNRVGQLGRGYDVDRIVLPTPARVPFDGLVVQVVAGWGHSLLLDDQGFTHSCGRNDKGQLGVNPAWCEKNTRGHPFRKTFERVATDAGTWGNVANIFAGNEHTALQTVTGDVYIWGGDTFSPQKQLYSENMCLAYLGTGCTFLYKN